MLPFHGGQLRRLSGGASCASDRAARGVRSRGCCEREKMPPLYRPREEKSVLKLYPSTPALKTRISDCRASEFLVSRQLLASQAGFPAAGRLGPVPLRRTAAVVPQRGAAGLPTSAVCTLL